MRRYAIADLTIELTALPDKYRGHQCNGPPPSLIGLQRRPHLGDERRFVKALVLVPSAESRRLTTNVLTLIVCVKNVGSYFPSPYDFLPDNDELVRHWHDFREYFSASRVAKIEATYATSSTTWVTQTPQTPE
jgi:hypothetical protein